MTPPTTLRVAIAGALSFLLPLILGAQSPEHPKERRKALERVMSKDSVRVVANGRYDAGRVHRFFLGDTYRDIWETPITVPVIDLARFAGGLKATEEGGGNQTRSLRFESADGRTWTFRPLTKDKLSVVERFEGSVIMDLFKDGLSGSFPGAPVVAPPFLEAVGIPHPRPQLIVMADDERLGEFRKDFARRLGTIEEHVSDSDEDPGFAGAVDVIESDKLLERLNTRPKRHADARLMLKARLVDLMLGDTDRHRDQWKWGKMSPGDSLLTPIPRDRDQVLATHDGLLLNGARMLKPYLVVFDSTYPKIADMVGFARDLDDRILSELDWAVWDSTVAVVQSAITDSVIHAGLYGLPREYHQHLPVLEGKLRARRDRLRVAARDYFGSLSLIASIHATDEPDRARLHRDPDGSVLLQLGSGTSPWYSRRFLPATTQEVRLFLHSGDDTATVTGAAGSGIVVRVVGGGGDNVLHDSTTSAPGGHGKTRLYDLGRTPAERYEPDSAFNRLPWLRALGTLIPPSKDWGKTTAPVAMLGTGRGLGIVPGIGIRRTTYGFRRVPYLSTVALTGEYSTATSGYRLATEGDFRFESSRLHLSGRAEMSEFEVVNYYGLGNDVPYTRDPFYRVDLRQWSVKPIVGYAFGLNRDVTLGPVIKYSTTSRSVGRFIDEERPYGSGAFGQVGLALNLKHDTRDNASSPAHGVFIEASAATYPAVWDVKSPFNKFGATASTYLPIPLGGVRTSVLALRAGGEKVSGDFPYFESAFVGGGRTLRSVNYNRLAGDASVFAASELRVPVMNRSIILPWDVGLLGYAETGRVFVDGESEGGWHRAVGAGFWVGVLTPATSISVLFTNARERGVIVGTGVSF
ncbi:MAG: BamA/TamA family outer membrane protein [Cytophagaceae bacterium]|nr:BamA/TamA family outer membrane protein [Gemmatimonadaceae bacterium]